MAKTGSHPVAQVLLGQPDLYEWRDYPEGGVWDRVSGFGYFYHAHPGASFVREHGHFHLFHAEAPDDRRALAAISVDNLGNPLGAFVANVWHVPLLGGGERALGTAYERFKIDLVYPCYALNLWLTALVHALRPTLLALHKEALAIAVEEEGVAQDRAVHALRFEALGPANLVRLAQLA